MWQRCVTNLIFPTGCSKYSSIVNSHCTSCMVIPTIHAIADGGIVPVPILQRFAVRRLTNAVNQCKIRDLQICVKLTTPSWPILSPAEIGGGLWVMLAPSQ